jgi:hypothetical protein
MIAGMPICGLAAAVMERLFEEKVVTTPFDRLDLPVWAAFTIAIVIVFISTMALSYAAVATSVLLYQHTVAPVLKLFRITGRAVS